MTDVKIVTEYPPIIKLIEEKFPLTGYEIFAWGDTIYNPSGNPLPVWLIEHEKVHFRQQGGKPKSWWKSYLKDPQFRLDQELEAHRVEYRVFCRHVKDRNKQIRYLRGIAARLASPMYGGIISPMEASKRIRK